MGFKRYFQTMPIKKKTSGFSFPHPFSPSRWMERGYSRKPSRPWIRKSCCRGGTKTSHGESEPQSVDSIPALDGVHAQLCCYLPSLRPSLHLCSNKNSLIWGVRWGEITRDGHELYYLGIKCLQRRGGASDAGFALLFRSGTESPRTIRRLGLCNIFLLSSSHRQRPA